MYIENRVDDKTRYRLCNGSVHVSTHMDNIEKHTAELLKINKHLCTYLHTGSRCGNVRIVTPVKVPRVGLPDPGI